MLTVRNKFNTLQVAFKKHTSIDEYENFVITPICVLVIVVGNRHGDTSSNPG